MEIDRTRLQSTSSVASARVAEPLQQADQATYEQKQRRAGN